MRTKWAWNIYKKEILETLRDRRTLFLMIAVPLLLYPIIFLVIGAMTESHIAELEQRTVKIAVAGKPPTGFTYALSNDPDYKFEMIGGHGLVPGDDFCEQARKHLLDEKSDVILLINSEDNCAKENPNGENESDDSPGPLGKFTILYDGANNFSQSAYYDLKSVTWDYSREALKKTLDNAGLDPALERPYRIYATNLAGDKRMGGHFAGQVLPMILILMVVLGAFYPAIDLSAGEKERGTIETLISAPVRPVEIVAGKYMAVVTISLIASCVNLGSMALTINRMASQLMQSETSFVLTLGGALTVFLLLIPASLFFSAVMLSIASLARTFKEAQNLLTPAYLALIFPAMVGNLPGVELNWATVFAPVINITLMIKEVLLGQADPNSVFAVMLANSVYAVLALLLAAKLFKSEQVLFSVSKPWKGWRQLLSFEQLRAKLKTPAEKGSRPGPAGSLLFFAITLVLLYYIASVLQARDVVSGLLITEWVLLLIPALLVPLAWRLDAKEVFSLRLPGFWGITGATFVGLGAWSLAITGATLVELVLPVPEAFAESMKEFFNIATEGLNTPALLFLFALSPAVCEEAAFRGVILSGFAGRMKTWQTVLVVGLLFGAFHLSIYRIVPTALIGMAITYAAIKTRSIIPAILIHFLSNALVFSSSIYPRLEAIMGLSEGRIDDWTRVAGGGVLLLMGLLILSRENGGGG